MTWSSGLKAELLVAEVTDDEIVAEDVGGEILDVLSRPEWRYVVSKRLQAFVLDMAEGPLVSFEALMDLIREEVARGEA